MTTKTLRSRSKEFETLSIDCKFSVSTGGEVFIHSQESFSGDQLMTDYVDSDFHQRVRDGEVFCNPCELTATKQYHSEEKGSHTHYLTSTPNTKYTLIQGNQTHWGVIKYCSPYQWSSFPGLVHSVDPVDIAKQKCLAHIDASPYEFFEDLMELSETLRFLRNPLGAIADVLKVYKRKREKIKEKKMKDAFQEAKALAALWNQYRFAFAPLVRSLMNAVEAFLHFQEIERPARRTAHGWGNSSTSTYQVDEPFMAFLGTQLVFRYGNRRTLDTNVHATVYYEVSNPLVDWNFALGLRLKDIPKTLWEIFPLSFMIDRVSDIKSMIQGLVNLKLDPTISILSAAVTTKESKKGELTLLSFWSSLPVLSVTMHKTDRLITEAFTYKRSIWEPALGDIVPEFTPNNLVNEVTKILDLIAIIISLSK